jgi:hypothetical protein
MSIEMPIAPESPSAELDTASAEVPDTIQQTDGQTRFDTADTTVLITEAEVLLGTAAATGLREKHRGWITDLRRIFAAPPGDSRPKPRTPPPRMDFLEDSRMAREMLRL